MFVVEEVTSWNLKDTSSFLLFSGHGRLAPSENKSKTMRPVFFFFCNSCVIFVFSQTCFLLLYLLLISFARQVFLFLLSFNNKNMPMSIYGHRQQKRPILSRAVYSIIRRCKKKKIEFSNMFHLL